MRQKKPRQFDGEEYGYGQSPNYQRKQHKQSWEERAEPAPYQQRKGSKKLKQVLNAKGSEFEVKKKSENEYFFEQKKPSHQKRYQPRGGNYRNHIRNDSEEYIKK